MLLSRNAQMKVLGDLLRLCANANISDALMEQLNPES